MYESKKTPGKKFGSSFAGKHYDENHSQDGMHSESPEHEAKETPEFEAGEQEGAKEHEGVEMNEGKEHNGETNERENDEGDEQHETHPVVAEHGPATKVVIHHDEKSGRHTVTSHHADGHVARQIRRVVFRSEGDEQHETHPVVAEHGPATKVVIHHDEKSGRHTVTSHHADGH